MYCAPAALFLSRTAPSAESPPVYAAALPNVCLSNLSPPVAAAVGRLICPALPVGAPRLVGGCGGDGGWKRE